MNVTLHQPNFFPRLKILQKLASADLWVVMDNIQYCHQEWQNRTRIIPINRLQNDFWLTTPVKCPNGGKTLIKDVTVISDNLEGKTKRLLKSVFGSAPYWEEFEQIMDTIYPSYKHNSLTEFNMGITIELLKLTGKVPRIIYGSTLPVTGEKSRLVATICEHVNADVYLCDSGGKRYLDISEFKNTKIVWQKWREPDSVWDGINSWRDISSINYLVREGKAKFVEHLKDGEFFKESDFY